MVSPRRSSSLQAQLESVMEALARAAVQEIARLVQAEREILLAEIRALRRRLPDQQTPQGPPAEHKPLSHKSLSRQVALNKQLHCDKSEDLLQENSSAVLQAQESPQLDRTAEQVIGTIKLELQEEEFLTEQDNSFSGSNRVEATSQTPSKQTHKSVPQVSQQRKTRMEWVQCESQAILNRSTSSGVVHLNQTSPKCTPESEKSSYGHSHNLSGSRLSAGTVVSGDKRFVCGHCSKRFRCLSQLTIHQRSHTGEKPYWCTVCGKRYIQKGHLYTHQRTHTGEKPYRCAVCGKGFIQKCTLDMHLRSHTGERPYICSRCGKGFTTKFNLKKHLSCQTCNGLS